MKKYGQLILKLRKNAGLTQEQLGKKLNVSYQAISKWENNLAEPDLETLEKLTDVLGITLPKFFELANDNASEIYLKKEKKKNIIFKDKTWILILGLAILIIALSLCAFLIPVNLSGRQIYDMYSPSVFYITAKGPFGEKTGSGFFVNNDGLAVTLYSNIESCENAKVVLNDESEYYVKDIIGIDEVNNLALIQIDIEHSIPVKFANSNDVEMGDKVYSISYNSEANSILAEGTVYKTEIDKDGSVSIQTTASSKDEIKGGVLFNQNGKAIGIVIKKLNVSGVSLDIVNVCIPINKIKDFEHNVNLSLYDYFVDTNGSYTIYFDGNGATSGYMENQICLNNYNYNLSANKFEKTGYSFLGWGFNGRILHDEDNIRNLTQNETATLLAVWEIVPYSITYELNNGTNSSSNPFSYTFEDEIILQDAYKFGYNFIGWFDNENFDGKKIQKIYRNSTGNRKLYAKFEAIEHYITYFLEDGLVNNNPTTYTIEDGIIILQDIEKEGYQFEGWFLDSDLQTRITQIDSTSLQDYILYCQFLTTKEINGFTAIETNYDLIKRLEENNDTVKKLILLNDLDLSNEELLHNSMFIGHFNGNDHTISNLIYTQNIFGRAALFGDVKDAIIENLTLQNISIFCNTRGQTTDIGAFASTASNSVIRNCHVINCTIKTVSNASPKNWNYYIGGVCGELFDSSVENCSASISIDYTNTYNHDNIFLGGVVGTVIGECSIVNSSASGEITCQSYTAVGTVNLGGVLGGGDGNYVNTNEVLLLSGCNSSVNFTLKENAMAYAYVGGVSSMITLGGVDADIKNSYYTGNIVNYNNPITYDFITFTPSNDIKITNCYSYIGSTYTNIADKTTVVSNPDGYTLEEIQNAILDLTTNTSIALPTKNSKGDLL